MPRILSLLVVCAVAAWWPSASDACSCAAPGSACQEFSRVDAVFVGRVISIQNTTESPNFGSRRVEIAVIEAFRGVTTGQAIVRTYPANGASCGYPFVEGETYLVYAYQPEAGRLVVTNCGRTRPAAKAADEIAYVRELSRPPARATARVSGQLQTMIWPPAPATSSDAFPKVRLTAAGPAGSFSTVSNTRGEFVLEGLPLGRYELKPDPAPGYEVQPITLDLQHAGACGPTHVTLWHDGRVSGRVVDPAGTPIGDLALELRRADAPASRQADAFLAARTTSDGMFEFRRVPPGEFLLRVAKNTVFHPGEITRGEAGRISVGAGQHVAIDDFHLPAAAAVAIIEGTAVTAEGSAAGRVEITVAENSEGSRVMGVPITTGEDGTFRVALVAGSSYTIYARRSTYEGKRMVTVESGEARVRAGAGNASVTVVLAARK
jgi:hypothetical protein